MSEQIESNILIPEKKSEIEVFDERKHKEDFELLKKEKEKSKQNQDKEREFLLKQLYNIEEWKDKKLFKDIFPDFSEKEKTEFSKFINLSQEDFDGFESNVWYRQYESTRDHIKAAKSILYYINNKDIENSDLLYRHAAQNLEWWGNTIWAIKILEHIKDTQHCQWKEYFNATLAFFKHDYNTIKNINNNRKQNPWEDINNFIGNTLENMEKLWKEWDRDYAKSYW